MKGFSFFLSLILVSLLFSWYVVHDSVSCLVKGAGNQAINGFYSAIGGMYVRRGELVTFLPDFYRICHLHNSFGLDGNAVTISLHEHSWQIFTLPSKNVIYKNIPINPEKYIFQPPSTNWVVAKDENSKYLPTPTVEECQGSLADSPPLSRDRLSNMEMMLAHPVTTFILISLIVIAYYLFSNRIEVSSVSFSYDSILSGEYWRAFTASIAHFDLMHLGFNCMSMYQLGALEPIWGSVAFAYLNIALIPITIAICVVITHVMITKYGYLGMGQAQSVGFSCVLFAWMVASSVRMSQYCPIFLFPSLCFSTYNIPIPFLAWSLPVNIGPFVLLVFTKFIIPRSSFLGHFSGIVIGYPLAWNLINWLTPPILLSILLSAYIWRHQLYVWKFLCYSLNPDLSEFVPERQLVKYNVVRNLQWLMFILWPAYMFLYGPRELPMRSCFCFLLWSAVHARRCEWMSEVPAIQSQCTTLVTLATLAAAAMAVADALTLGATVGSWSLLTVSCALSEPSLWYAVCLLSTTLVAELALFMLLVLVLHDLKHAAPLLTWMRLDATATQEDMHTLGLSMLSSVLTRAQHQPRTLAAAAPTPGQGRAVAPPTHTEQVLASKSHSSLSHTRNPHGGTGRHAQAIGDVYVDMDVVEDDKEECEQEHEALLRRPAMSHALSDASTAAAQAAIARLAVAPALPVVGRTRRTGTSAFHQK